MNEQGTSSIVRLIGQNGTVAGIGYLIPDNCVVTCAHMVALALGISKDTTEKPESEVTLDFPLVEKGKQRKARVLSWRSIDPNFSLPLDELDDVAVLEIIEDKQKQTSGAKTLDKNNYDGMIDAIKGGGLIPFLGAGVNLCDRPEGQRWCADSRFLPSGEELSRALALEFGYPWPDSNDLLRVSQYVTLMHTIKKLYESLRTIFDREYPPTSVHKFFAKLPGLLRSRNYPSTFMIFTTNYDDLLESAFKEVNQPYELLTYWIGDQNGRGKLLHWTPQGKPRPINDPSTYEGIKLDENDNLVNPVILKVHGAVDRPSNKSMVPQDSYVITEDNYLEYLTRSDIATLVPATLRAKFPQSGFLFLGYSLRDWNLRVFLNRIYKRQKKALSQPKSWAIQKQPAELDQKFWEARGVEIFDANLSDYITNLEDRVNDLPTV